MFRVSFEGCLGFTASAPEYAATPDDGSANKVCASLARKFWSREPSEAETKACAQVALVDSASESDPRRRWAYTCASLLTAAGFLSY